MCLLTNEMEWYYVILLLTVALMVLAFIMLTSRIAGLKIGEKAISRIM